MEYLHNIEGGGRVCGDKFIEKIVNKSTKKKCDILNFSDPEEVPSLNKTTKGAFNKQFINTMGIMSEIVENNNKISMLQIISANIVGNIMFRVILIVSMVLLMYFVLRWIYTSIKNKLDRFEGAIDQIEAIWVIVDGAVRTAVNAIKRTIEAIKKWFDEFDFGELIVKGVKKIGSAVSNTAKKVWR